VLGLSVDATTVRGALVDANGNLHHQHTTTDTFPNQLELPETALLTRVKSVAATVLSAALQDGGMSTTGTRHLPLLGASISWPSPLDRSKRLSGFTFTDPSWLEQHRETGSRPCVPELLSSILGDPFTPERCHALHDVSAHALSLAFGESRYRTSHNHDFATMWRVGIVVRLESEVSAAAILMAPPNRSRLSFIDSKLIEGTRGLAGEIGHLQVNRRLVDEINKRAVAGLKRIEYEKWKCPCGSLYHLGALAGLAAVHQRISKSNQPARRGGQKQGLSVPVGNSTLPQQDLARDNREIQASIDVGRLLGHALSGPIAMLDPWKITLTGSLANQDVIHGINQAGGEWGGVANSSVQFDLCRDDSPDFVGVRGSALAVIRQVVYRDFLDQRDPLGPVTFAVTTDDVNQMLQSLER
jgi:predicted NBD/HSP70 family sugar kinase